MIPAQRLFLLCAVVGSIMLLLLVPFRGRVHGESDWIVYSFFWDPPLPFKTPPGNRVPYCPDGGLFLPILLVEHILYFFVCLALYNRLSRDEEKLEAYPGYHRGF